MIGDQHIDAERLCFGDLGQARRSTVDGHDDRGPRLPGGRNGCPGEAVALVEPARDVRDRLDPESPERDRQDCEAGEPVRVEVPEHEDPFTGRAGAPNPAREHVGVGQEARVVERIERRREEAVEGRAVEQAPSGEQSRDAFVEVVTLRRCLEAGVDGYRLGELPAIAGFDHDVRMPRPASPRMHRRRAAIRRGAAAIRRPRVGSAARGSRPPGRAVGRPIPARRRGSARR